MGRRFAPLRDPVAFRFDGEEIVAERGESIAAALVASGRVALARSPKLHRPRGPSCMRGGCDGCGARVNGVPRVKTCLTPCLGGEDVRTETLLGKGGRDALRVVDWLFPSGFDHHHLLAGVPVVAPLVQHVARRVTGAGELPDEARAPIAAEHRALDVLVVGAGAAGLAVGAELASRGLSTLVADDALAPGGSWRGRDPGAATRLVEAALDAGAELASRTTVAGLYGDRALLVGEARATVVSSRAVVVASGRHDGVLVFANGDIAGVYSARGALLLAAGGVSIGARVALVGDGPDADALERALDGHATILRVSPADLVAARGSARVRGVTIGSADASREERVDAVAVDVSGSPAHELLAQAGARVRFDASRGVFVVERDESGRAGERVWAAGEVAGVEATLEAVVAHARGVATAVALALG